MGAAVEHSMSREFGDHSGGFFHQKVAGAADDARGGDNPLTNAWGKVLDAMRDVAWTIASVEAGDAGNSDLQMASVAAAKQVRDALYGVDVLIRDVIDVQRESVRAIIEALARVEVCDDEVKVFLPCGFYEKIADQPQRLDLIRRALADIVRQHTKSYGWVHTSSSSGGSSNFETHRYAKASTVWHLKGQVRAALADGKVAEALKMLDVDPEGFDLMDRKLLEAVIHRFDGGPVGLDNVAAAIGEESGTIEDVIEPYLIMQGFLQRTPRGRIATLAAYRHLGVTPPQSAGGLFG